jgi:hypothetical protein
MSDKKPADYTKGLRNRKREIEEGIPSQKDMDALIKFEEKSEKSVPKPKRKPKPPMKKKVGGYMKKMKKGGKVGKYSCSHNRLY